MSHGFYPCSVCHSQCSNWRYWKEKLKSYFLLCTYHNNWCDWPAYSEYSRCVGCPRGVDIPHSICNAHCSVPQWYSSARLRTTWVPILAPIPCNNNYLPLSSSSTFSLSSNNSRKWFPGTWWARTWSFCVGCRWWRVEWHKQSGEIPWWTHRLEPNDSVTSRRE